MYGPLINTLIPTEWTKYSCRIGKDQTFDKNYLNGAAFVKIGFLWDRFDANHSSSEYGYLGNVQFYEDTASQVDLNTTNNNLATNYSTTSSMNSAINQSKENILLTVSQTYATAELVNDIQVGGQNLLRNSTNLIFEKYGFRNATLTDGTGLVLTDCNGTILTV